MEVHEVPNKHTFDEIRIPDHEEGPVNHPHSVKPFSRKLIVYVLEDHAQMLEESDFPYIAQRKPRSGARDVLVLPVAVLPLKEKIYYCDAQKSGGKKGKKGEVEQTQQGLGSLKKRLL